MNWKDVLVFNPLVQRLAELDLKLDQLARDAAGGDVDGLSLLDDSEAICGEGFLQCQLYMIERKGTLSMGTAYACGPKHNGRYLAEIIHAAGNYRKHGGEWPVVADWGRDQIRTVTVFHDAGALEDGFWLWNLLIQLTGPKPALFATLVPQLIEWREALDRLSRQPVAATTV